MHMPLCWICHDAAQISSKIPNVSVSLYPSTFKMTFTFYLFYFKIPEFDNLYLDMNGIIHVCSHPEDDNPHFRITEEKIFADIMYYIEVSI